jgi:hypothetical protein
LNEYEEPVSKVVERLGGASLVEMGEFPDGTPATATYTAPTRDPTAHRQPAIRKATMPYAEVNDVRLYYEDEGQGEPLLLLHGALGAVDPAVSSSWAVLRPALAERYRTVSLEHRGHGRSDNPAGLLAYAQLADDVAASITRLDLAPSTWPGPASVERWASPLA